MQIDYLKQRHIMLGGVGGNFIIFIMYILYDDDLQLSRNTHTKAKLCWSNPAYAAARDVTMLLRAVMRGGLDK